MSDYKIETGARMLELRKKNNKSQSDVAKYLGLTVAAYQNYETGRREAGYEVLANLADFYGVSTDLLLGRCNCMETKEILKQLRKSKDLSMQEFCIKAEISFSTYQNYETGKRIPTADILVKLADFYGVTTDYLLGRDTDCLSAIDRLATEFNLSTFEKKLVEGYVNLPKEIRTDFMEFLHKVYRT